MIPGFLILSPIFQTVLMPAGFFCLIECQIRRLVQAVKLLPRSRKMDAHTGCDIDDFTVTKSQVQILTDSGGLRANQFLRDLPAEKRRKFIAAQAPDNIARVEET